MGINNDILKGFQPFDPNEMKFGDKENIEDNILNSLLSLMLFTMMAYFSKRVETTKDILNGDPQKILQTAIYKSFVHLISHMGVLANLYDPQSNLSLIHISEPTRPLYISYAVFCLKKKKIYITKTRNKYQVNSPNNKYDMSTDTLRRKHANTQRKD
eukprot:TRINITY_DN47977_c0_g1_i1.p1 TRINITY_DN47977_c0_g1~~TRINITY_DN47977_c0_g1_i1.p1  ORF type:complete len:157 (+),score=23.48 TRINITY_DN47977_c0_g1_i1:86-556(+)